MTDRPIITEGKLINCLKHSANGRFYENYTITEGLIEKYSDKLWASSLSIHQELSEQFIEKFKDGLRWDFISEFQKLSKEFIKKFKGYVHYERLARNKNLSKEFRKLCFIKHEIGNLRKNDDNNKGYIAVGYEANF